MYGDAFWTGDMALSAMELMLCEAYERNGRLDLAECVKGARVHQLLDAFFSEDLYSFDGDLDQLLPTLHAMTTTLIPGADPEHITSLRTWEIKTEQIYVKDEGLPGIRELQQIVNKGGRRPSTVLYPIKKWIGRIWQRCQGLFSRTDALE